MSNNKFESIPLPNEDTFGFLLRRDHPLSPRRQHRSRFVWKKNQVLSPAAELFLRSMKARFSVP